MSVEKVKAGGVFTVQCFDDQGNFKWEAKSPNLVVNGGLKEMNDKYFTERDPASFTARGSLIYNASKSNKAIAVLDFGSDKTATATFTVQMPANTAASALIRFS